MFISLGARYMRIWNLHYFKHMCLSKVQNQHYTLKELWHTTSHWNIHVGEYHSLEHKQHMLESHQDLKLGNVEDEKIMNIITLKNNLKSWNRKIPFFPFWRRKIFVCNKFFLIFQFLYMLVYNLPTNTMCIIQNFLNK